jgi:hypothetical protein
MADIDIVFSPLFEHDLANLCTCTSQPRRCVREQEFFQKINGIFAFYEKRINVKVGF